MSWGERECLRRFPRTNASLANTRETTIRGIPFGGSGASEEPKRTYFIAIRVPQVT